MRSRSSFRQSSWVCETKSFGIAVWVKLALERLVGKLIVRILTSSMLLLILGRPMGPVLLVLHVGLVV